MKASNLTVRNTNHCKRLVGPIGGKSLPHPGSWKGASTGSGTQGTLSAQVGAPGARRATPTPALSARPAPSACHFRVQRAFAPPISESDWLLRQPLTAAKFKLEFWAGWVVSSPGWWRFPQLVGDRTSARLRPFSAGSPGASVPSSARRLVGPGRGARSPAVISARRLGWRRGASRFQVSAWRENGRGPCDRATPGL